MPDELIYGLDISSYQDYLYPDNPEWNKYIDWEELKSDQYNFRFIWVKIAEGLGIANYPLATPTRQVLGAKSVNFEAINGYHFHYFQEFMPLINQWVEISPKGQAETFLEAWNKCNVPGDHPMTDCEDPSTGQFLVWKDTPSANAALAFARRLNNHLKIYHAEVNRLFGKKPDIYTGAWWWNRFGKLILQNNPAEAEWWKLYKYVLADYDGVLTLPDGFTQDMVIAWQKTSTPDHPVKGIPTGRRIPGDALDIDVWMQSEEAFKVWCGKEITTMASIHVQQTPQKNRARILTLEGKQKLTVSVDKLGVDALILPMGGMDRWEPVNGHMQHYVEDTFAARCAQYSQVIPVIGMFRLDAKFWGQEQYTAEDVEGMSLRDNFILGQLLNAWHVGPWTMDSVLAKQSKWQNISALILSMTETGWYAGGTADAGWQAKTFINVAERVKFLQDGGFIPNIPVMIYTGPWWLYLYDKGGDFTTKVLKSDTYKSWQYLMLGQWIRKSTATFNDLSEIFAFPPEDTFSFKHEVLDNGVLKTVYTYPDGYFKRILCHEFSGNAQKVKTVVDASGNPTEVKLSLWCDTKEKMYEFLKFQTGTVPPPPADNPNPEVPPAQLTLEQKVDSLMADVKWLVEQDKKRFKEL